MNIIAWNKETDEAIIPERAPTNGEWCRIDKGAHPTTGKPRYIKKQFFESAEPPVISDIYLDIQMTGQTHSKKKGGKASVGNELTFTVTMQDEYGGTLPINDSFAVPITDRKGAVVMVKDISFVNGVATTNITMTKSSYYYIEPDAVNEMSEDANFIFEEFVLAIYE